MMDTIAIVSWFSFSLIVIVPLLCEILGEAVLRVLLGNITSRILSFRSQVIHMTKEIARLTAPADFVAKAKLERELIVIEKQIHTLEEQESVVRTANQQRIRYAKTIIYAMVWILTWGKDVIILDRQLLWPFTGVFTSQYPSFGTPIGVFYLLPLAMTAGSAISRALF